jgi:hypothetical protein
MPGCLGLTCGDRRVLFSLHAGHGLRPAPGIPCALCFSRVVCKHNSDACVPRERGLAFPSVVMPRACGASSAPRPLRSCMDVSGILGRPVEPGDDDRSGCLKFETKSRFLAQTEGRGSVALAIPRYRCYIAKAKLRCASGAIISPGPYRSFRELSLAGSVDPDIWCPPTFVGNSGIECFNGYRGFALFGFLPLVVIFQFQFGRLFLMTSLVTPCLVTPCLVTP